MGNTRSKPLSSERIDFLLQNCYFSREEIHDAWETFRGVGSVHGPDQIVGLTRPVFMKYVEGFGLTESAFTDRLFDVYDVNNDNIIDFEEYIMAQSLLLRGTAEERLLFYFELYDMDNDGLVNESEFRALIAGLLKSTAAGHADARASFPNNDAYWRAFRSIDMDGDGMVSIEDFRLASRSNQIGQIDLASLL